MSLSAQQTTALTKKLAAGHKAFLGGYGRIAGNVQTIVEAELTKLEDVAAIVNKALEGVKKEDVGPLDKAYMMASKRKLKHSFGVAWDEDEKRAVFRIPTKEGNKKKDPFKQAVARFIAAGPTDADKKRVMDLMDLIAKEAIKESAAE